MSYSCEHKVWYPHRVQTAIYSGRALKSLQIGGIQRKVLSLYLFCSLFLLHRYGDIAVKELQLSALQRLSVTVQKSNAASNLRTLISSSSSDFQGICFRQADADPGGGGGGGGGEGYGGCSPPPFG